MLFAPLFATCGLASFASASLFVTSPVGSTVCRGGKTCRISWINWGNDNVTLKSYGPMSVSLYTGSQNTQVILASLGTLDPSRQSSMSVTIPSNIGPSAAIYFVRFQQTNPANGAVPLEAFSARFTLNGMNGQLSASASAALQGVPVSGASSASAMVSSAPSSSAKPTSAIALASGSALAPVPASAASASTSSGAGKAHVMQKGLGAFVAIVGGLAVF